MASGPAPESVVLNEPTFVIDSGKSDDYKSALVSPPVNVSELMDSSESRPTGVADDLKKDLASAISSPSGIHNLRFETASDSKERKRTMDVLEPADVAAGKNDRPTEEPLGKKQKVNESGGSDIGGLFPTSAQSNMVGHGANDDDYLPANHKFQLI